MVWWYLPTLESRAAVASEFTFHSMRAARLGQHGTGAVVPLKVVRSVVPMYEAAQRFLIDFL